MSKDITVGANYWILESGHTLRKVRLIRKSGNLCTIKFLDHGGGIRVSENRLLTDEDAEKFIDEKRLKRRKNPYEYLH